MMKTISIIVTTYNSEETIGRTLRSIMNQQGLGTIFDLDLIVVDDCSSDRTLERVREYNAKVFSTEQNSGGPNKGRNIGLKHAKGDYICIVDHDDEWMPNKIVTQLPYLERVPIVTCNCIFYDEVSGSSYVRSTNSNMDFVYFKKNETFLNRLARNFRGQIEYESGAIYWGDSKNIPYEEYFGMTDYDRQLLLYHNRDSIEVCEPLFYRYLHKSNLSKTGKLKINDGYMCLAAIGRFSNLYPKESLKGMKKIYENLGRYYYLYANNMPLARSNFWKSRLSWKILAFIFTSFVGSEYVKRRLKKVDTDIPV